MGIVVELTSPTFNHTPAPTSPLLGIARGQIFRQSIASKMSLIPQRMNSAPPRRKGTGIAVAIVEDGAKLSETLAELIDATPGLCCIAQSPSAEDALARLPSLKPDVVLMDINLPSPSGLSGIDCTRHLHLALPDTAILMLTILKTDQEIFSALEAGASGYLLKSATSDEIIEAIQDVHRGGSPMTSAIARRVIQTFQERGDEKRALDKLSPRESEIIELVAQGYIYKEIGDQLDIGVETVRTHLHNVYLKLHVKNKGEAVARYYGKH